MKLNQIETRIENKQVYGYKRDGNTVTAHRWKVFHLCGNLYLQEPKADKYGQRYAHIALFFPNVKIGLDLGILTGWQLDQYSIEDVTSKIGFTTVQTLQNEINTDMESGCHIKDSYIAFVRQYNAAYAEQMQAYKKGWKERTERERQAKIAERKRKEELERRERARVVADMLKEAEQAIISGGRIVNKEID